MPPTPETPTVNEGPNAKSAGTVPLRKRAQLKPGEIQVDDKLYSAEKLAAFHPGGELFVKAFAGCDATEAFLSYHRREFPHKTMGEYVVGEAVASKEKGADADYLELCDLVQSILPRNKSFANWTYYLKVAVILGCAVGIELYIHVTKSYHWQLTAILGWFMAVSFIS